MGFGTTAGLGSFFSAKETVGFQASFGSARGCGTTVDLAVAFEAPSTAAFIDFSAIDGRSFVSIEVFLNFSSRLF